MSESRHRLPTLDLSFYDSLIASFHELHRSEGYSDQEGGLAGCLKEEWPWGKWTRTQSCKLSFHQRTHHRSGLAMRRDFCRLAVCTEYLKDYIALYEDTTVITGAIPPDHLPAVSRQQSQGVAHTADGCHMGCCNALVRQNQVQDPLNISPSPLPCDGLDICSLQICWASVSCGDISSRWEKMVVSGTC